jgi:hypothetical protein
MPAIITDTLKRQLIGTLFTEATGAVVNYYIGVGRSETWDSSDTVPTPTNSLRTQRNARFPLQAVKKVADVSYVVPRYTWSQGSIYNAYDDIYSEVPDNSYYVLTDENQVYICLQQGRNSAGVAVTSTIKPTGTLTIPFTTADGYVWKYLYSLSGATSARFLSSNFVPVQIINDSATSPLLNSIEQTQAAIQEAASPGQIVGIKLKTGGTGYTSAPTVSIDGSGSGAAATATISGGAIVKIEMNASVDSGITMGHSYTFAGISFSGGGGSGATARAILGPDAGIGADVRNDLSSTSLMFNVKPAGAENDDFFINQDFRQIVLMKSIGDSADGTSYSETTGRVLRYLQLTSVSDASTFQADQTITAGNASAIIDAVDSDRIYAHQTEETGFVAFAEGASVSSTPGAGTLKSAGFDVDDDAFTNEDVNNFSGDILYIENRAAVLRSADQTEDIKVVISL